MKKVCNFCGNKNFTDKKVQYIYKHNGHFLIINKVPCEECDYCGEQYFKANVLKKIEKNFQKIHTAKKKVYKQVKVPVEEFITI